MSYLHLAIIWPLIGALVNGLFGKYLPRKLVSFIACFSILLSALASIYVLVTYLGSEVVRPSGQYIYNLLTWIDVGGFTASYGFIVDPLSLTMAVTVSVVSFLIHVYSIGYMARDEGFSRYFTYLNLFVAMMLLLVTADNLVLMFVGWEGVGLCSYLLIGFWYRRPAPPVAGMKAFIVNRVGDFAFLIGIFVTFAVFGTVEFSKLAGLLGVGEVSPYIISVIALFLFGGAVGKSAQFPLHVWLPDAMEGPTPVSALIHAATMVTAGVYMVARLNFLYSWSETALLVVAFIGAFTAIFSASMALVNNDIKRVMAYSTVSQLGYMFLSAGLGAYWVAIFHLMTHAFFKALLFLSAGVVLHALKDELDMRKMGGLAKFMPQTYVNFLIGAMAISGVPLLSGFFSKDEILFSSFTAVTPMLPGVGKFLWVIGIITAVMTAFYMFRQIFLVFLTKPRFHPSLHPHDPPRVMTVPLWALSFGSVFAGYIGLPALFTGALGVDNVLKPFLGKVLGAEAEGRVAQELAHAKELGTEAILMGVSVIASFLGIFLAYYFYRARYGITETLKRALSAPYQLLYNKYYVDEFYQGAFVRGGQNFADFIDAEVDRGVIDGLVNSLAFIIGALGQLLRSIQTGFIRNYAWYMSLGALLIIIILWKALAG